MQKKDKRACWCYEIIWKSHKSRLVLKEDMKQVVENLLYDLCEEVKGNCEIVKYEACQLSFKVFTNQELHINKWVKNSQKKLTKVLGFATQEEVWDQENVIITKQTECAKQSKRLTKILQDLEDVGYYDLDEYYAGDLVSFKSYMEKRHLTLIEIGARIYLLDNEALLEAIHLNCFACTKIYKYGCCCGAPCGFSAKNMNQFDKHLLEIEALLKEIDPAYYEEVSLAGGFVSANGNIKALNGHCSLLVKHENAYKCITHKYALDKGIPVYDLCPLSCLMYPLEILELIGRGEKKVLLITSVLEETFAEQFGRWGSYQSLDVDLRCINKKAHDELFKEEAYKPVYKVNKGLITHELGEMIYEVISHVLEEVY